MQLGEKIRDRFTICREGEPDLHVQVEVVPVRNDSGRQCGAAMILEDVSETAVLAKEAEEALLYKDMQADIVQQLLRRLGAVKVIAPSAP